MNLANLGLAGIMTAQNRLQVAGHNINNADTVGYNRQSVLVQTAGAVNMGAGYIGRGVQAVTVQRSYDNFLQRQLVTSQSEYSSLKTFGNEIQQIDNLFADRTAGVSPALQNFFDSLQAVASKPADPAARQELIGRSNSLVTQLNDTNKFIDEQRDNINTQLETVVKQINSYAERIQDVNRQITIARASGGNDHEPNDLLDQRDQLFAELNEIVNVRASEQDGKFNLILGNGQVLLGGNTVYPLETLRAAEDPSRLTIAYTAKDQNGELVKFEMDESRIKGGTLGGLLRYRSEALDAVQNELGRVAVGVAVAMNEQHAQGYDLNGNLGSDFFTISDPKIIPSDGNNTPGMVVEFDNINALSGQDYRIEFDGSDFTVKTIPGNFVVDHSDPVEFSNKTGLSLTLPNPADATAGDSWLIQPTRASAGDIKMNITAPDAIAAAGEDPDNLGTGLGGSDNTNALLMAAIQGNKILGNSSMNLNEAFSQIVNRVAVMTQQNKTSTDAQEKLVQQNFAAQQAVSGVNLDEEYVNLDRYQEQFRAASRLIDVSSTLFDTLLSLKA